MSETNFAQLLQFFKVLGNESRLKIIGFLANEERSVGELAELLNVKEPTVSHHLAMMKEMGLVDARAEGTNRIYWLETNFLAEMSKGIFSQDSLEALAPKDSQAAWDEKVLRTFVKNGRLQEIPVKNKKKLVLLRWLVEKFEHGIEYPEKEINQRINQYYHDHAMLRRYLVDFGFMERSKGTYWRVQ